MFLLFVDDNTGTIAIKEENLMNYMQEKKKKLE